MRDENVCVDCSLKPTSFHKNVFHKKCRLQVKGTGPKHKCWVYNMLVNLECSKKKSIQVRIYEGNWKYPVSLLPLCSQLWKCTNWFSNVWKQELKFYIRIGLLWPHSSNLNKKILNTCPRLGERARGFVFGLIYVFFTTFWLWATPLDSSALIY